MEQTTVKQTKKHVPIAVLVIYCVLFYGAWAVFELLIKDHLAGGNPVVMQLLRSALIKNLVWTLPAMLLVHKYADCVFIRLKEMFTNKIPWLKLLCGLGIMTVYLLISAYRTHGKIALLPSFGLDSVIIVLFVGITEEMVFRGWLLNATAKNENDWLAVGVNAVMFLCIHFPIWIHDGEFVRNMASFGFVTIILLSVLFSYIFLRTKNLLVPVLVHMVWDLLAFMFI